MVSVQLTISETTQDFSKIARVFVDAADYIDEHNYGLQACRACRINGLFRTAVSFDCHLHPVKTCFVIRLVSV